MAHTPLPDQEPPPPILGSWTNMYIFVLVLHAVIIFLFYLFTHAYA
ncbi:MAG: hypothetical protein KDC54_14745 [Lewinella sp.]|nr:hypothetical protein [Lewinella sp.]